MLRLRGHAPRSPRRARAHGTLAPKNFDARSSLKKLYKPQVPEYFNFARNVLDAWTEREKRGQKPQSAALWWVSESAPEVRWSFEELAFNSRRAANVLCGPCGLRRGDRVLLLLPRVPQWWLLNVACMRTGTVLIPGTCQLTARDILHRLQSSRAKCVITDESLAPVLDSVASHCSSLHTKLLVSHKKREGWMNFNQLLRTVSSDHTCVETRSDDPMTIFFTSGTTGSPKMTEHSHCSFGIGLTVNGRYWLDLTERDVLWNTSDTGWAKSAWSSIFAPWIQGSCVFVHHMPRFDTTTVMQVPNINILHCPNCVQNACARRHVQPINPEVMERWKASTGLDIYEGYGQTETVLIAGTFKGMEIKPGSFGKPSPAYDVQIVDDACKVVPQGTEGNLAIRVKPNRPFSLFTKYRIGPFEVENALTEHEAVAESAVVSSPDPVRGEIVKAFVVLNPAYKSTDYDELTVELQEHVKRVTAPYKYPRKIEFVDQLPKTVSGKIRRVELRNKEWGRS
ncbi:acyl-coenzyme A synthetase ACSM3, mitochondrial-like [Scleropages formosus]|uniref:medium-chain acyl-CoA ligase n=1 Tax=Scleropages formosus TaxID=113540 RepID=A0A0P7Y722_SCLFO|nr:acyl-coenzyme A synthetase ACSM3, mitochondrial-like [Scleropages formosus]